MSQNSLIGFSNAIISDAEKKRSDYVQKLKIENEELIKSKENEFRAFYEKKIDKECAKADSICGRTVSGRRTELKRYLMKRRGEMADAVFAEAAEKLSEYAETDEYRTSLAAEFEAAVEALGGGILECTAREKDIVVLKKSLKAAEVKFEVSGEKLIGGFVLKNAESRLITDCTLDSKLEEQRTQFAIKSGLTIE